MYVLHTDYVWEGVLYICMYSTYCTYEFYTVGVLYIYTYVCTPHRLYVRRSTVHMYVLHTEYVWVGVLYIWILHSRSTVQMYCPQIILYVSRRLGVLYICPLHRLYGSRSTIHMYSTLLKCCIYVLHSDYMWVGVLYIHVLYTDYM